MAKLRAERGWTLKHLANLTGISISHLSAIEHGTRPNPSFLYVVRLSEAFGVPIEYFCEEETPAEGEPEGRGLESEHSAEGDSREADRRERGSRRGDRPQSAKEEEPETAASRTAETAGGDAEQSSETLRLARRLQQLYDEETRQFIAAEGARPYVSFAKQLAESAPTEDPSALLQLVAQFIREHRQSYPGS
ncbi:MAG: helix-turn-helix transcriptional regulator [Alicyclobacillus sp.]|nr:helix-turn-helix transcriptional regulator [Alicyclobacillus sp.]